MAVKLYLVWNKAKSECVGFLDKKDADWTATGGNHPDRWTPSIGEAFRDTYAGDEDGEPRTVLPQSEVDLPE